MVRDVSFVLLSRVVIAPVVPSFSEPENGLSICQHSRTEAPLSVATVVTLSLRTAAGAHAASVTAATDENIRLVRIFLVGWRI